MLDGIDDLATEVRAFRQEGLNLSFSNADYAKMGMSIFVGLFLALVLADQLNKRL